MVYFWNIYCSFFVALTVNIMCYNRFVSKSIHKTVRIPEDIAQFISAQAEYFDRSFNYILVEKLKFAIGIQQDIEADDVVDRIVANEDDSDE